MWQCDRMPRISVSLPFLKPNEEIKLHWQSSNQTFPIIRLVLHVSIGSLIFSEEIKVFGIGRPLCHYSNRYLLVLIFLSNLSQDSG